MSKSSTLTALTFCIALLGASANSQAQTLTDPGMSAHNYKMPNKAAMAKKNDRGQHFVATMDAANSSISQPAAKYAVAPSSIKISTDGKTQPMSINPLSSVANYKTQPVSKMQSTQDEYSAYLN